MLMAMRRRLRGMWMRAIIGAGGHGAFQRPDLREAEDEQDEQGGDASHRPEWYPPAGSPVNPPSRARRWGRIFPRPNATASNEMDWG